MKNKFIFFGIIALLFIFPLVTAAFDTPIKIKTLADHKVSIFIYESGKLSILESKHINSGIGDVSFVYSSPVSRIDIRVKVIDSEGKNVFNEFFEGYDAGKQVNIRVDYDGVSGEYVEAAVNNTVIANNSVENTSVEEVNADEVNIAVVENKDVNDTTITGAVISSNTKSGVSNVIYVIVGIFVIALLIILFVVRKSFNSSGQNVLNSSGQNVLNNSGSIKVDSNKPSTFKQNNYMSSFKPASSNNLNKSISSNINNTIEAEENYIRELEAKIKDAEKELSFIKNRERIKLAEKRLDEDRKELERLKKEE